MSDNENAKMVLVTIRGNYADEFDFVTGHVTNAGEWFTGVDDPRLDGIDLDYEHVIYFGTNEFVTYSVRQLIKDATVIPLETENELRIAKLMGTPFGRVFDIVTEQIQAREERKITERNIVKWQSVSRDDKQGYADLWYAYISVPYAPYYSPEWEQRNNERNEAASKVRDKWQALGMEGYISAPQSLDVQS